MNKMKRTAGAAALLLLLNVAPAFADSQLALPPAITYQGQTVKGDQGAVMMEMNLYVPLRFIVEAAGGKVEWDEKSQSVSVTLPDRTATFVIGQDEAEMNEAGVTYIQRNMIQMAGAVKLMNGRTMVTSDALFNILGLVERADDDLSLDLQPAAKPSGPVGGKLIPGEAQVAAVAVADDALSMAMLEWRVGVVSDEAASFKVQPTADGVIVGIAGGLQPTGGYTIELLGGGARLVDGIWYVDAQVVPPTGMATMALTNPVAFFHLPGVSGDVQVNFWTNGATP